MNRFTLSAGNILLSIPELGLRFWRPGILVMAVLTVSAAAFSQDAAGTKQEKKAGSISIHATGTFEVKLTPQKPDNKEAESAKIGRMSSDKQFHGDLEGTSAGEMLA